jgi:hypothetical protein
MEDAPHPGLIARRAAFLGALAALAGPRLAAAAAMPDNLSFQALRNGRPIGEQQMAFDETAEGRIVRTTCEFIVKLGPITAYRYRHEATERWNGSRFQTLETETHDNGKLARVSARNDGAQVQITAATGAMVSAPAGALPFTHWNRRIATAPLFNPQDGKLLRESVSGVSAGSVKLANGSAEPAQRVAFRGDVNIDDWYDASGVWSGLSSRLKDGSTFEYRRL